MPNLTPEKEAEILAALKAKVASVTGAINVVAGEPLLDSKSDVLKTICHKNLDNKTEVRYLKIDFLGFTDSAEDGCEDMPVVFVSYNLHLFHQFVEKRSDASSSAKDIKTLVMNLRNKFLETAENARSLAADCEHAPLVQNKFIILGNDELTGYYGHFTDLTLKVEIL